MHMADKQDIKTEPDNMESKSSIALNEITALMDKHRAKLQANEEWVPILAFIKSKYMFML